MNTKEFVDFISCIEDGIMTKKQIMDYAKEYFTTCGELDSLLIKMTARTISEPQIVFTGDRGDDGLEEIKDSHRITIEQQKRQDRLFEAMGIIEAYKDRLEQPQQVKASKSKKTFKDKVMAENKEEVLKKLHLLIDGKRGKNVALVIVASVEMGLIQKPTYKEVKSEFGDIGAESGYNNYLDRDKFTSVEYEGIKTRLSD